MVLDLLLFLTACAGSQGLHVDSLQQTLQDKAARFADALAIRVNGEHFDQARPSKIGAVCDANRVPSS